MLRKLSSTLLISTILTHGACKRDENSLSNLLNPLVAMLALGSPSTDSTEPTTLSVNAQLLDARTGLPLIPATGTTFQVDITGSDSSKVTDLEGITTTQFRGDRRNCDRRNECGRIGGKRIDVEPAR